jgi:hypothetical protein
VDEEAEELREGGSHDPVSVGNFAAFTSNIFWHYLIFCKT